MFENFFDQMTTFECNLEIEKKRQRSATNSASTQVGDSTDIFEIGARGENKEFPYEIQTQQANPSVQSIRQDDAQQGSKH